LQLSRCKETVCDVCDCGMVKINAVRVLVVCTYSKLCFHVKLLSTIRYGGGAGNTVEENSSVFSLMQMR